MVKDVKLFENEAVDDEIEKALNYLTTVPQNEGFLESVKTSGKKLCMDLAPNERESRINEMVSLFLSDNTAVFKCFFKSLSGCFSVK